MRHECYPSPCQGPPSRFDVSRDIKLHDVPFDTKFREARRWNKWVFSWRMDRRFFDCSSRIRGIIDASVQNLDAPENELISWVHVKGKDNTYIFYDEII